MRGIIPLNGRDAVEAPEECLFSVIKKIGGKREAHDSLKIGAFVMQG